jgi:hypothetical protein
MKSVIAITLPALSMLYEPRSASKVDRWTTHWRPVLSVTVTVITFTVLAVPPLVLVAVVSATVDWTV